MSNNRRGKTLDNEGILKHLDNNSRGSKVVRLSRESINQAKASAMSSAKNFFNNNTPKLPAKKMKKKMSFNKHDSYDLEEAENKENDNPGTFRSSQDLFEMTSSIKTITKQF